MVDITYMVAPPIADIGTKQGWDLRQVSISSLVIHSNTTDGSTTFADAVGTHSPAVGAADVEHDTDQKKWGTSSILFDGDSGYLTIDDHADWDFNSGAFTIDFWVRLNSLPDGSSMYFYDQRADVDNAVFGYFYETGTTHYIRFYHRTGGVGTLSKSALWTPSTNTWYHIAIIRGWGGNANDHAICVNGTEVGTTLTDSSDAPDIGAALEIGRHGDGNSYLDGWIDEYRICKGTAVWTANFIPPYGPYC